MSAAEAVVAGRICVDLYPEQLETPLEDVESFRKFVGGFAGNVGTGLARLGVRTSVISGVGDDSHGVYIRRWLEAEGIDAGWLAVHPTLRTALAFCEAWPPNRFPITFYRTPTCPDWEITRGSLDLDAVRAAPLLFVSGTGLAREPSRLATLAMLEARAGTGGISVLDLDWRPAMWDDPGDYSTICRIAARDATVVLGSDEELRAAVGEAGPAAFHELGVDLVFHKHGPNGVTVCRRGVADVQIPPHPVAVVNGLGAGDAFAAAIGYALLRGHDPAEAARLGNRAGAFVAARLGCSIAMPRLAELDA